MKSESYVGITDFMTGDQARAMTEVFVRCGGTRIGRLLMVGVMMSHKTLHGLPTKWTAAFPAKENVSPIFLPHAAALNTLHYADYENVTRLTDLEAVVRWCGPNLDAIQFDMVWPEPKMLAALHAIHPSLRFILQVGKNALAQANDNPVELVRRLDAYDIHDVLLDRSMGRGKPLEASVLMPFIDALIEHLPHLDITVAGGLGPDTFQLVEPLVRNYRSISVDAQGQLRASGNALDPIDWPRAVAFLEGIIPLLSSVS